MGAVLHQELDGRLFPVAYAKKNLADRERNFSTMERECLAIVWGVRRFSLYLYGRPFVLETDHQPLAHLQKAKFINRDTAMGHVPERSENEDTSNQRC